MSPVADYYRIDYSITRRLDGEGGFTEIGFGSSGDRSDLGHCVHDIQLLVQHRQWETTDGMPDPDDVAKGGEPRG